MPTANLPRSLACCRLPAHNMPTPHPPRAGMGPGLCSSYLSIVRSAAAAPLRPSPSWPPSCQLVLPPPPPPWQWPPLTHAPSPHRAWPARHPRLTNSQPSPEQTKFTASQLPSTLQPSSGQAKVAANAN